MRIRLKVRNLYFRLQELPKLPFLGVRENLGAQKYKVHVKLRVLRYFIT